MAGMTGFNHKCESTKVNIQLFKKSLRQSNFSKEQVDMIWDFYVTHSFAAACGQTITLVQYGWKETQSTTEGFPAIERYLRDVAGVADFCFLRAKTAKDTLSEMGLSGEYLCIEHPRMVALQEFGYASTENEEVSIESRESRITCLFRHIRNAFAHGNTYFFDNGNMLLEDKDGTKITARMLIKQKTLLDWIKIIDKKENFYKIVDSKEKNNATLN